MNTTTLEQKERTAQLMWTAFILMFFVIQAIIWTIAISITSRDESHAVVANYDEQALKWDEVKAMQRASYELGWQSQIAVDSNADIRGHRGLKLKITDKDGNAVDNAMISLQAFHRGRASEVQNLEFTEVERGTYQSTIQLRKTGNWQFSGVATKQADCYLIETHQYIQAGDS